MPASALLVGFAVVGALLAPSADAATIPAPPAACAQPLPTEPLVDSVAISPAAVDVRAAAKTVTITVHAHDTVDVASMKAQMHLAGSSNASLQGLEKATIGLRLVAGTATDGTWSGSVVVPRWGRSGRWTVEVLALRDVSGGLSYYAPGQIGITSRWREVSWGAGWSTGVTVKSQHDATRPVVTAFRAGRRSVDARTGDQRVSFIVATRDTQSGVASVEVLLRDSYGDTLAAAVLARAGRGAWTGSARIYRWSGSGTWTYTVVSHDRAGNTRSLSPRTLAARGWASRIAVRSGADLTEPRLVAMSFPSDVDTTAGSVRVPISLRMTDTGSGITEMPEVDFSPRGLLTVGGPQVEFTRVTGTPHDRTYAGFIDLPQCFEPGDWYPLVVAADAAGNQAWFMDGFPPPASKHPYIHYTALDSIGPLGLPHVVGDTQQQRIDVTFSEPTLLDRDPAAVYSLVDATNTPVPGRWWCTNVAGEVPCEDDGAAVSAIHFTPTAKPAAATWSLHYRGTYPDVGIYDISGNAAYPLGVDLKVGPGAGWPFAVAPTQVAFDAQGRRIPPALATALEVA